MDTTPLGLKRFVCLEPQGCSKTREPWAVGKNSVGIHRTEIWILHICFLIDYETIFVTRGI
jgi:hypothetical protein